MSTASPPLIQLGLADRGEAELPNGVSPPEGFTDEERAAMQERAREQKAAARRGPRAEKADGEGEVLAKIAEMPGPDRVMAERPA